MAIVYLDIETVPEAAVPGHDLLTLAAVAGFEVAPDLDFYDRRPPANYRDPAKIEAWWAEEMVRQKRAHEEHRAASKAKAIADFQALSLDPMRCRVLCAGVAVDDGEPDVIVGDERQIMRDLAAVVEGAHGKFGQDERPTIFVAHNGKAFDFPVLRLRAYRHGVFGLCRMLHSPKPYSSHLIDTLEHWPSTQHGRVKAGGSMDKICEFLGVLRRDNPIKGSEVLGAYMDGRMDDIVAHCRADVRDLRAIYQAIRTMGGGL